MSSIPAYLRTEDEGVKEYLRFSENMVKRAEKTVLELVNVKAPRWRIDNINQWLRHSRRQIDQVERRLVKLNFT